MKYVVRKIYYDFEKEEKYLNAMSAKGLALSDYSWCRYVFENTSKGEYIYRIELLENLPNHPESQNYIRFMEESGVEFVASYMRWVYFRRKAADGEFDIYSDMDSKIGHYKRIYRLFFIVMSINIIAGLSNFYVAIFENMIGMHLANFFISIPGLIIGLMFLIFLILPLNKKIHALENEKEIHE